MSRRGAHLARDAAVLVGIIWFVYGALSYHGAFMVDGLAYWSVGRVDPYAGAVIGSEGAFLYSPVAAQVFGVIGLLPLEVFVAAWLALNIGIAAWLIRPYPLAALMLALPIADALRTGQVELVMAATVVLGFRRPYLWAIPILTKLTPGVGLVWFAVRREWRPLAIALGTTAAIIAVSFVLVPNWWRDWLVLLTTGGGGEQYPMVRIAMAALLLAWGAHTARPWTMAVATVLALPVIYIHSLAMLLIANRTSSSSSPRPRRPRPT